MSVGEDVEVARHPEQGGPRPRPARAAQVGGEGGVEGGGGAGGGAAARAGQHYGHPLVTGHAAVVAAVGGGRGPHPPTTV